MVIEHVVLCSVACQLIARGACVHFRRRLGHRTGLDLHEPPISTRADADTELVVVTSIQ